MVARFPGSSLLLETANLVGVNPVEYLREAVLAARAGRVLLPGDLTGV